MAVQKLLIAKIETTEDTDVFGGTPTKTNIIDTEGLEVQRYAGDKIEKELDRHLIGNREKINVSPQSIVSFKTLATGFGVAGTAALYDPILRMCGFARTDDATVGFEKNTYELATVDHESGSLYSYLDDIELYQLITGVRGIVALSMAYKELPKLEFSNLIGSYNRPVQGNAPTLLAADWAAWEARPALAMNKANTATFTLDGYQLQASALKIDWGIQASRLDLPNFRGTLLTDRKPTASLTVLAPKMSLKDFYPLVESHAGITKSELKIVHGTSAGETWEVVGSEFQISDITDTEVEGRAGFTIEGQFTDVPKYIVR